MISFSFSDLADLLYPKACVLCDKIPEPMNKEEKERFRYFGVCPSCTWENFRAKSRAVDAAPAPLTEVFRGRSMFTYDEEIRDAVLRFKYEGMKENGIYFARWMMEDASLKAWVKEAQALVPIPLSAHRLKTRGYNQALEFCKELSRLTDVPVRQLLARREDTKALKTLSKTERQRSVEQAFMLDAAAAAAFRTEGAGTVVLVDDIATTFATLKACRSVLLEKMPDLEVRYLTFSARESDEIS